MRVDSSTWQPLSLGVRNPLGRREHDGGSTQAVPCTIAICGSEHRLDDLALGPTLCPKTAERTSRLQKLVAGPRIGHIFYDQSGLRLL